METEYIKRDDAINGFVQMLKQPGDIYPTDITTMLQSIPPADVRPVVNGKWIKLDMHRGMEQYKCSICRAECYVPECMGEPMYDYCPCCAADMRGGDANGDTKD